VGNRERDSPARLSPDWPDAPSADADGETARKFALSLKHVIGDRSVRSVAALTNVSEGTIRKILAGAVWPDLLTMSRLERGLGADLYHR